MVKTPDRTDKTLVFRIIARRFPRPRVYRKTPTEPTKPPRRPFTPPPDV